MEFFNGNLRHRRLIMVSIKTRITVCLHTFKWTLEDIIEDFSSDGVWNRVSDQTRLVMLTQIKLRVIREIQSNILLN